MELRSFKDVQGEVPLATPPAAKSREECRSRKSGEMRHILVPLDGSPLAECVLPFAAVVAHTFAARVTLLRVLEAHHEKGLEQHVDPLDRVLNRDEARSALDAIMGELEAAGVPTSVEIVPGYAAEQILHFAEKEQVDLIVLSSHGEGGVSAWMLSSTVLKVVLRAPTSVLVVPAYAWLGRRLGDLRLAKILLPLDCSRRAEGVLPLATALARAHDAELILTHVVLAPELPRHMDPPCPEDLSLAAQLTKRNRAEAERYLTALHRQVEDQGVRARVRILESPRCGRSLRTLADEENVDLLLLSAHGKTGDAGERYGGVAAQLMQRSNRPIVIIQDLAGSLDAATPAEQAVRMQAGH